MGDTGHVSTGTLYVVATPIGNLEDITLRAARLLGEVDLIACEDTRHTRKLLEYLNIHKPLVSCHEHNEAARADEFIDRLLSGDSVALVSDAGTPLVSDPGFRVVSRAVEEGIAVVPLPGPSAALAALAASGLPSDSFLFLGFLPSRASARRRALERAAGLDSTIVLYEAPHRILAALADIAELMADRRLVAAREVTKMHEEFLRGTAASVRDELASRPAVKGEFTIVIGKPEAKEAPDVEADALRAEVRELIAGGTARMDAIKSVARRWKLPKRKVYEMMEAGESPATRTAE